MWRAGPEDSRVEQIAEACLGGDAAQAAVGERRPVERLGGRLPVELAVEAVVAHLLRPPDQPRELLAKSGSYPRW